MLDAFLLKELETVGSAIADRPVLDAFTLLKDPKNVGSAIADRLCWTPLPSSRTPKTVGSAIADRLDQASQEGARLGIHGRNQRMETRSDRKKARPISSERLPLIDQPRPAAGQGCRCA